MIYSNFSCVISGYHTAFNRLFLPTFSLFSPNWILHFHLILETQQYKHCFILYVFSVHPNSKNIYRVSIQQTAVVDTAVTDWNCSILSTDFW